MKVKLVSDGTSSGTFLTDLETGEPLTFDNCTIVSAMWRIDPSNFGPSARLTLGLAGVPVDLVAEGNIEPVESQVGHG